jgi:hypothetical protein
MIDDTQGVEVELDAVLGAAGNLKVLFIEMIEELPSLKLSVDVSITDLL